LPLEGDRKPISLLQTPFNEVRPQFSPDGKWIAYESDEAGTGQIYIQSFPPSGAKWQVSTTPGSGMVRWRADGKEIYFASLGSIWAAGVRAEGGRLEVGAPRAAARYVIANGVYYFYDPTVDGKRFIAFQRPEATAEQANAITVVTNWQAMLK